MTNPMCLENTILTQEVQQLTVGIAVPIGPTLFFVVVWTSSVVD